MLKMRLQTFCAKLSITDNDIERIAAQFTDQIVAEFFADIDKWMLTSGKEVRDYDFYLYRLVLDGAEYMKKIREAVVKDFLTETLES